jgi:peptide/nickel transport system substrate-binding protein
MKRASLPRRVVLLIGVAAAAAALAGGIISSRATAASPTPATSASGEADNVVVRIGTLLAPDSLNPFIGWSDAAYAVFAQEYLLLCSVDSWSLQLDDRGVAKSWEVSPDGLTWTFYLNEGITWHDGEPLTAEDVAFTFNYIIENEMSAYISFLGDIERAVAVDPYTVEVICTRPRANLPRTWLPVFPEHIWSEISPEDAGTGFENLPPSIGSGPYQVVEWKRNQYVRMVANKDFWLGPPAADEVLFVTYQNADTMVADLKSGSLAGILKFPQAQYEPLKNTPGVTVEECTLFGWSYVAFNCYDSPDSKGHPVLLDADFRKALEYAIDRESIVQTAYYGQAVPGHTFMPPDVWSDPDYSWQPPDEARRSFDLAKANQLLDEAGYVDGDGNGVREYEGKDIVLRLWALNEDLEGQSAVKLTAGWFRDVGVKVRISVVDEGAYYDAIWGYDGDTFAPDFDLYYWEWGNGYYDPAQSLNCYTTAQIEGWNELAWSNAEFDRLDGVQNATLDENERAEVIRQMQQVMYEDCPVIVTAHRYQLNAYRTDTWQGWDPANQGKGPTFFHFLNAWSFYNLEPTAGEAGDNGANSTLIVVIVVVAAAAAVGAFLLVRRSRRGRATMED